MRSIRRLVVTVALVAGFAVWGGSSTAFAAVPGNDDFVSATVVAPSSLPFNASVTIDDATVEPGEGSCYGISKSVWYSIAPSSTETLRADISTSSIFDRVVNIYRRDGEGLGGLSLLTCASPYYNGLSSVTFTAQAGQTYYIQTGAINSFSSGALNLSLTVIPPPANDNFASATAFSSLPYQNTVETSAATVESGEPALCTPPASERTVWYAYTPTSSGSVTVPGPGGPAPVGVAVYTGSSLGDLALLTCQYGFPMALHVNAGTTYYFQLGTSGQIGGQLQFMLNVSPQPVASFSFSPGDPSSLETVQFYDYSYDPGYGQFSSRTWSFGDGTSSTNSGCCGATHRYSADGDYTVTLTVTTADGRTASTQQTIHVSTHDVGITQLTVPSAARAGQTKSISATVRNSRYSETVRVDFYESVAGGYQLVGSVTQSVPAQGGKHPTAFSINYTFTTGDASAGKVVFQAVATIVGARDAFPADNTAFSSAVRVSV